MEERLQKVLSQWGVASRRQAEQMIRAGRVRINDQVALLGQKVNLDQDKIEVDGRLIEAGDRPQSLYLLIHKPINVVSTCEDPWGRLTVLDLLPKDWQTEQGIHPVGRLDANSTGALLLTNDGAVTFALTHPSHEVSKTYQVQVRGVPSEATLQKWRKGVLLDQQKTLPAQVKVLQSTDKETDLEIVMREGRNRQIRRVAMLLGHPVKQLHRTAIGSIQLGSLAVGKVRSLTPDEIKFLQQQAEAIALNPPASIDPQLAIKT